MKKFISIISLLLILTLCASIPVFAADAVVNIVNLHQSEASTDSVTVTWSNALTAKQYVSVELSLDNKKWEKETDSAKQQERIYGLTPGTTYYIRARMVNSNKYGNYTNTIKVTTQCSVVEGLRQTKATKNSATFKWNASKGATSYKFCKWVNNQEHVIKETTNTSYTLKNLKNTKDFDYEIYVRPVRKVDDYVAESVSDYLWRAKYMRKEDVRLTPQKLSAPIVPTIYTAILSGWGEVNKVPYADKYQFAVYTYNGKKPIIKNTTSNESFSIKTIKKGTFYKIKARAYNSIGKYGSWSKFNYYANTTIIETNRSKNKKMINVSWKKVKGATSYTIYMAKGNKYKDTGFKKVKTLNSKKTNYKIKKFNKKTISAKSKYTLYVVANKKVGKKTYKSSNNSFDYV